jgi:hypothetical protein
MMRDFGLLEWLYLVLVALIAIGFVKSLADWLL